MFKPQADFTNSLFGSYAYDPIISRNQDHILVKMDKLIDWSFVEEETADRYSDKGQHAIHPLRIFKLLVIQHLYDMSEREVALNADCNIIFRHFAGLGLSDTVPHWTELGKFKERIGIEALERLFYRVLDEAERLGIRVSGKRIADATDISANVDLKKCAKDKQDDDDHGYIDRNTTDQDARFGKKGAGKGWYGYKSHINEDAESELVMSVITTDAAEPDESQLVPLIDKERDRRGEDTVRRQGGDKGYVGHTDELAERKILDYTIPRDNMKKAREMKNRNKHYLHLKYQRYKVEQKFAESKNRHGLEKARHRGRWRVHLRSLIIYLAVNLKRIVNLLVPRTA